MRALARNPEYNTRADYVVVGWEAGDSFHPLTPIATGRTRGDVTEAFKSPWA